MDYKCYRKSTAFRPESKLGWPRGNTVSNTHVLVFIPWPGLNRIDKCASMAKIKLTPILHWPHGQFVDQDLCIWWVTDITDMTFCYSVIVTINAFPQQLIEVQYIPRNMHMVFALLCFVVVIHWLIIPYPSGLLHWHCGNLTIAQVPAKQPWWIWINTSCESIMNDCITTTRQSTTKPCAYFLGYTVV